jgi:hypothetical protein
MAGKLQRGMPPPRFRRVTGMAAVLACGLVILAMARTTSDDLTIGPTLAGLILFCFWNATPIMLWAAWAEHQAEAGAHRQTAALIVGALVGASLVALHVQAWSAVKESSTGALIYLSGPFVLLVGTGIAILVASAAPRLPPSDSD